MNSTSWRARSRSVSPNRALFIHLPDLEQGFDELLDATESLLGRQPQHLADLGPIDALVVVNDVNDVRDGRCKHANILQPQLASVRSRKRSSPTRPFLVVKGKRADLPSPPVPSWVALFRSPRERRPAPHIRVARPASPVRGLLSSTRGERHGGRRTARHERHLLHREGVPLADVIRDLRAVRRSSRAPRTLLAACMNLLA